MEINFDFSDLCGIRLVDMPRRVKLICGDESNAGRPMNADIPIIQSVENNTRAKFTEMGLQRTKR